MNKQEQIIFSEVEILNYKTKNNEKRDLLLYV